MERLDLRAHVEEICASQAFGRSQRATRLLRYLLDARLTGRASTIKEYDLGLDVFDRGQEYDPKLDSIVRTEVTRLRARLQKYYECDGAAGGVRLQIPRGSYELHVELAPPAATVEMPLPRRVGSRWTSLLSGPASRLAAAVTGTVLVSALLASFRTGSGLSHQDLRKLTPGDSSDRNPVVSRDGKWVAYGSDRAGDGRLAIWLQHTEGGEPRRLTAGQFDESLPHFSPDGSQVAYRAEGEPPGVYVATMPDGPPRLLAANGTRPRFSSDGRMVAYEIGARGGGAHTAIWLVPTAGGQPRELLAGFRPAMHPLWSLDDRHILVWGGQPTDWWIVPVAGGAPKRTNAYRFLTAKSLTFGPATDWLDDHLYFRAGRGDAANIHRVAIRRASFELAGEPERITFGSAHETSASVTLGGHVVFLSSNIRSPILQGSLGAGSVPTMMPGDRAEPDSGGPSVSGDGRLLAYVARTSAGSQLRVWEAGSPDARVIARAPRTNGQQFGWIAALHPGGALVAVYLEQSGLTQVLRTDDGTVVQQWTGVGEPHRFTADGKALLTRHGEALLLVDWRTGQSRLLLSAKLQGRTLAAVSPDGARVAFAVAGDQGRSALMVAPVHRARASTPDEWTPLPGSSSASNPVWAPDGAWLYFLSEREAGHRCLWRMAWRGGAPASAAEAVAHLHDPRLNASHGWPISNGLSLGGGRFFLRARSETASVWMSR